MTAKEWVEQHEISSMQEYIHDRMREFDITEHEIEFYYNTNVELFGGRSLEESSHYIDRILRIQRMKHEFLEM